MAFRMANWPQRSTSTSGKCPLPEHGGPELCSRAEILRLFQLLQKKLGHVDSPKKRAVWLFYFGKLGDLFLYVLHCC